MGAAHPSHLWNHEQVPLSFAEVINMLVAKASALHGKVSLVLSLVLICALTVASLAVAQSVSLSPTPPLNYGNVAVGTSSTLKETVTNTGIANLIISSVVAAGDYSQTNTCGSPILPNKTCTITITFSPTITGTRVGSVTVTDNATNSPQTISLTGVGVLQATLSGSNLAFGNQGVGVQSVPKTLTLTNTSSSALKINSVSTTGDFAQINSCGTTVPAKTACTIFVTFTPTVLGTETGTLTISDSASNAPQTATLTGTGVAVKLISITVYPANPPIPLGTNLQFAAIGSYNYGAEQDLTQSVTWSSSASSAASVSNNPGTQGLATSLAQGPTTISAALTTFKGSTTLTVTPPALISINVTPEAASQPAGRSEQFLATGTYTDGSMKDLTASTAWTSSDNTIATVNVGLATTHKEGSVAVTASLGSPFSTLAQPLACKDTCVDSLTCPVTLIQAIPPGDGIFVWSSNHASGGIAVGVNSIDKGGTLAVVNDVTGATGANTSEFQSFGYVLPSGNTSGATSPIAVTMAGTPNTGVTSVCVADVKFNGTGIGLDLDMATYNPSNPGPVAAPTATWSGTGASVFEVFATSDTVSHTNPLAGISSPYNSNLHKTRNNQAGLAVAPAPPDNTAPQWSQSTSTSSLTYMLAFSSNPVPCTRETYLNFSNGTNGNPVGVFDLQAGVHGWRGGKIKQVGTGTLLTYDTAASMPLYYPPGRLCGDGVTYAGSESSLGLTMTTDPNTPAKNFNAIQYSWGFSLTNYAEFGFWFSNDAPDPAHGGGTWRVDCGSIKGLLTPAEQLAFNCYQDSTGPFFMLENVSGNSNKIRVAHSIIASGVFLRGIYDHTGVGKANCPGAIGQYTLHVYQAGSPPREVSGSPVRVCDGSNTPDWPAYIHIGNNISNSSFNGTYHFHWSNVQYRNDGGSIQP